jgi:hypothetical protein
MARFPALTAYLCEADGCPDRAVGWRSYTGLRAAEAVDVRVCAEHGYAVILVNDRELSLSRLYVPVNVLDVDETVETLREFSRQLAARMFPNPELLGYFGRRWWQAQRTFGAEFTDLWDAPAPRFPR